MSYPRISVVMSVYNGERFLKKAIQSVLAQTCANFEFIIIDDGCSPKSKQTIDNFKDQRIVRLDNQKNIGLSASLNKGIALAKGEYVIRMDADDLCLPDRFQTQINFMDAHPEIDICGSWAKKIGHGTSYIIKQPINHESIKAGLIFRATLIHPSVIIRKTSWKKYGLAYNPSFKKAQDYELWTRAVKNCRFANIPKVLLHYRKKAKTHSFDINGNSKMYSINIRLRLLKELGLNPTKKEIELHQNISHFKIKGQLNNIRDCENWLTKINQSNNQLGLYDNTALKQLLAERWYSLCHSNTSLGLALWKNYHRSTMRLNLKSNFIRQIKEIKLFSKSII